MMSFLKKIYIKILKTAVDFWLTRYYGERCKTRAIGCGCCDMWAARDMLVDDEDHLEWTLRYEMCERCYNGCGDLYCMTKCGMM